MPALVAIQGGEPSEEEALAKTAVCAVEDLLEEIRS